MNSKFRDARGVSAVEFSIVAPVFLAMIFGVINGGLALWIQLALQHGSEMAARCASVNKTSCGNTGAIQSFASQQSYGLNPPLSTFAVNNVACGIQVQASYTYRTFTSYFGAPSIVLAAQSCFPQ